MSITVIGVANVIKMLGIVPPLAGWHLPRPGVACHPSGVSVTPEAWLDYSEVADIMGVSPGRVRRLVEDRILLAKVVDGVKKVPSLFLRDGVPLPEIRGTATVLIDGGMSGPDALDWILSVHEVLGIAPIDAMLQGRKTEVRRLAQAEAL